MFGWLSRKPAAAAKRAPKPPSNAVFPGQYRGGGCWWDHPAVLPLAAGRGFNFDVAGESQFQANLASIVGGKRPEGFNEQVPAQLVFEDNPVDPNAVGVMIDTKPVGWIAADRAAEFRAAILAINSDRKAVTCKAKIVGGWDRGRGDEGHFGVKISVAWPLKIHPDR